MNLNQNHFDTNSSQTYYKIPKELLSEILSQATFKRNRWEFPNEAWIEADTCIEVVQYIIENSEIV